MIINASICDHKGCIIKKKEEIKSLNDNEVYDTFNMDVDNFLLQIESQKLDLKIQQQEKDALKKLENVKKDHDQRLKSLLELQEVDKIKPELITRNQKSVEACEDLRNVFAPQGLSSHSGPAKYSFILKVIDGITVAVNTVKVVFKSPAFIANVEVCIK